MIRMKKVKYEEVKCETENIRYKKSCPFMRQLFLYTLALSFLRIHTYYPNTNT